MIGKTKIICLVFFCLLPISAAHAEIKLFEKEVEEVVASDQSREQVEAFALQKAKRLAVEEAGTYISSLSVVQNYKLSAYEVTALASGIVEAKIVGGTSFEVKEGNLYVRVRAVIKVDTSILDRQVQEIMKEKDTLKKLEEERKKNRELEEKYANLKSSEVKRLEELNTQAMALERERDRQRLFREEQALKAKGELSQAEAERIAKEREMQERISRTLAEQERAKREEAAALAAEQDRVKRAQLENEQRWNDLSRKAKLAQESWAAIDDSLSLRQAMTEANDLKQEIANFKKRLDFQYRENTKNLAAAYEQQRTLTTAKLPPRPAPKDAFETTAEYNKRMDDYDRQVRNVEKDAAEVAETLKNEESLKLAEAKVAYLGQQLRALEPFIQRLQNLQDRKFTFPEGGAMTVELGEPEPDNNRFPVRLQHNGKSWVTWWNYTDRNSARDFYQTRTYLKAEGLFQIEEAEELRPKLTAARVAHPGTKETREFGLETPRILTEVDQFTKSKREQTTAKESRQKASVLFSRVKVIKTNGRFSLYDNGTVLDIKTQLMWASRDNGHDVNWYGAKNYCENYRGGGYTDWRMPTKAELAELYDESKKNQLGCRITDFIDITYCCPWALGTPPGPRDSNYNCNNFHFGSCWRWTLKAGDDIGRVLPVRSAK